MGPTYTQKDYDLFVLPSTVGGGKGKNAARPRAVAAAEEMRIFSAKRPVVAALGRHDEVLAIAKLFGEAVDSSHMVWAESCATAIDALRAKVVLNDPEQAPIFVAARRVDVESLFTMAGFPEGDLPPATKLFHFRLTTYRGGERLAFLG